MIRLAVVVALLATPLAAQRVVVDSTFDVYSRTSRTWIASAPLPTGLPGLAVYVAARTAVGPSDDPSFRYTVECEVWAGLEQAEAGTYWTRSRVPVDLLLRRGAGNRVAGAGAIRDATVTVPCRERPGDAVFRLTSQRQAAIGITAQLYRDGGTAVLLEFPSEFFDAVQAVLARADSSLVAASRGNRTKATCR